MANETIEFTRSVVSDSGDNTEVQVRLVGEDSKIKLISIGSTPCTIEGLQRIQTAISDMIAGAGLLGYTADPEV